MSLFDVEPLAAEQPAIKLPGSKVLTFLTFVENWGTGMIDTFLLGVGEDLPTSLVHAL